MLDVRVDHGAQRLLPQVRQLWEDVGVRAVAIRGSRFVVGDIVRRARSFRPRLFYCPPALSDVAAARRGPVRSTPPRPTRGKPRLRRVPYDHRVGSALSKVSQQSFGRQCDPFASVETAPPRIGTPAARFSSCRSVLAASRRGADGTSTRVLGRGGRRLYAATAVRRTSSRTAINSSTVLGLNKPSGPCGVRSVNGDSYSRAASITPCSVR